MVTKNSIISFYIIIFGLITLSMSQPEFLFSNCNNNANFTTNGTYARNLDNALSSLTSDANVTHGLYNESIGQPPDRVNVIALCRGDVELPDCRSCINDSSVRLRQICPLQKGAIGWYEKCILRYSNSTIFGNLDTSFRGSMWNVFNASNVTQFNQRLDQLMDGLRIEASGGGSLQKYASGNTSGPGFSTIYGLVQCSPDLSERQCFDCLDSAVKYIPTCCDSKRGGRVLYPSCNIRYEDYRFFNNTVLLSPPTPPLSPPTRSSPSPPPHNSGNITQTLVIVVVSTVGVILLMVVFVCVYIRRKRRSKRMVPSENLDRDTDEISTIESLQYSFDVIRAATNDFSDDNKLGEGGFGSVYKGKLQDGQEIAVKRLAQDSGQGEHEFKNEVLLLARLQHRNLVRLLGFTFEGSERILMYEFVQNASLDRFIFDPAKRTTLDWERRYKIIGGVARGLLYLHEDSRLKIIHRDLKASNILLDNEMNPKIADFGLARLFEREETRGNTSRIVGTYGYMAPEYALHGEFSHKSDVFSFGVLVLEIVTGRKNHTFQNGELIEDLLTSAWKSWKEAAASSIIDVTMRDGSAFVRDMMRCIHIGLLCVQENIIDRPTMATIVLMLNSFSLILPVPSEPAFFMNSNYSTPEMRLESYTSKTSDSREPKSKSRASKKAFPNDTSMNDLYPQ